MTVAYLLPCSCGSEVAVERAQAGGSVRCACGHEIDVPPLGALMSLRSVGDAAGAPESDVRGAWKRTSFLLLLVGALVVGGAMARVAFLYAEQPRLPSLDRAKPAWTIVIWKELRKGVEGPLFRDQVNYHKRLSDWESRRTSALIVALAGVIVLVPGILILRRVAPARV